MGKIIHEVQNLSYLSWSKYRSSSGTAGSFLKAYDDLHGKKRYYKLSNYDSMNGIVGHECVNEIIADRLLTILGIPHLEYTLIHAEIIITDIPVETYLCMSEDFKKNGESKVALDTYFQAERNQNETLMEFCRRNGWSEYIWQMLLVDFLISNRDRHGANIEVLRSRKTKSIRLAPLFDNGLSLLFSCHTDEEVQAFDVLKDMPVQCCVGSNSAFRNLELIPKQFFDQIPGIMETDRGKLFDGLDGIISPTLASKIWEMIWKRWQYIENICSQG